MLELTIPRDYCESKMANTQILHITIITIFRADDQGYVCLGWQSKYFCRYPAFLGLWLLPDMNLTKYAIQGFEGSSIFEALNVWICQPLLLPS